MSIDSRGAGCFRETTFRDHFLPIPDLNLLYLTGLLFDVANRGDLPSEMLVLIRRHILAIYTGTADLLDIYGNHALTRLLVENMLELLELDKSAQAVIAYERILRRCQSELAQTASEAPWRLLVDTPAASPAPAQRAGERSLAGAASVGV